MTTLPNDGDEVVVLTTDKGEVVVRFHPDHAPNHVENFKSLAKEGFYDGTRFHRCIAGFMVQGGDPNSKDMSKSHSWGTGGSGRNVNAEFNKLRHTRGILSMARSSNPNSASSQFFIMVADSPHLDGQYSAFGEVVSGMEVVDQIVVTGDARNNGSVNPANAIQLQKAEVKTWPL